MCYTAGMEIFKRAMSWIRANAAVLALFFAVLTFGGGTLRMVYIASQNFSTLATREDVTTTVSDATKPLSDAVERLNGSVEGLNRTVGDLREDVARLEGTVSSFETSVTRSSTTLTDSVDTLNDVLPILSCAIEYRLRMDDDWQELGGQELGDRGIGDQGISGRDRFSLEDFLLRLCRQALDPQAMSER